MAQTISLQGPRGRTFILDMSNATRIETLRKMVLSALDAANGAQSASEADHWTRQALASGKELASERKKR